MTGRAEYVPIVTRNKAAYSRCGRVWTVMRMAKPVMAIAVGMRVKRKRCLSWSEKKATMRAKTNEQAQGGTLCSWVPICV